MIILFHSGLTLEESTDLSLLYRYLENLDRQLKELDISFRTRYVSKAHKMELKDKLDNKVSYRDTLVLQGLLFRAKQHRLKIAVEAAQAYNRVKPPHQTVGDAVFGALQQAAGLQIQEKGKSTVLKLNCLEIFEIQFDVMVYLTKNIIEISFV